MRWLAAIGRRAALGGRLRLLPLTMVAMALLLVVKSAVVVRAAIPTSAELRATTNVAPATPVPAPAAASAPVPAAAAPAFVPVAAALAFVPVAAAPAPVPVAAPVRNVPPGLAPPTPSAAASAPIASTRAKPPNEPISDSERDLLLDLRRRRADLELRETALGAREAVLSGAERRLFVRVDELTALQARLEALETGRRQHDEANWRGLVKLYEAMRPRDAAVIFNDLDRAVLLAVLDRMKEAKAAPVLAAMLPDRARQATTELAQMRTLAAKAPASP